MLQQTITAALTESQQQGWINMGAQDEHQTETAIHWCLKDTPPAVYADRQCTGEDGALSPLVAKHSTPINP